MGMHETNSVLDVYFGRFESEPLPIRPRSPRWHSLSCEDIARRIKSDPNSFAFWFKHYFRNHTAGEKSSSVTAPPISLDSYRAWRDASRASWKKLASKIKHRRNYMTPIRRALAVAGTLAHIVADRAGGQAAAAESGPAKPSVTPVTQAACSTAPPTTATTFCTPMPTTRRSVSIPTIRSIPTCGA